MRLHIINTVVSSTANDAVELKIHLIFLILQ